MRLGIGPFFLPIAQDLGFSRSLLASIVAVGMLCYGLAMPLAGLADRARGTRRCCCRQHAWWWRNRCGP
jgi:cyanate permease